MQIRKHQELPGEKSDRDELLMAILENSEYLLYITDPAGRILFANRTFFKMLRHETEGKNGKSIPEPFLPVWIEKSRNLLLEVFGQGNSKNVEEVYLGDKWDMTIVPIGGKGTVDKVAVLGKKIDGATLEKKHREVIEEKILQISETTRDTEPTVVADVIRYCLEIIGRATAASNCHLFLQRRDEFTLDLCNEWSADDRNLITDKFRTVKLDDFPFLKDLYIRRLPAILPEEGSSHTMSDLEHLIRVTLGWKSALGVPISLDNKLVGILGLGQSDREKAWNDEEAEFLAVQGERLFKMICQEEPDLSLRSLSSLMDETHRKAADSVIMESEKRLRQVFRQSPEAVLIVDEKDLKILEMNNAASLLYGYDEQDLESIDLSAFFGHEMSDEIRRFARSASNNSPLMAGRIETRDKEGEAIFVSLIVQKIMWRERAILYCISHNLTDLVRYEEENKHVQAMLIQNNKMNSLGLMVSSVAHEIKNPNNSIMFNVQLAADMCRDILTCLDRYNDELKGCLVGGLPYDEVRDTLPKMLSDIFTCSTSIKQIVSDMKNFYRGSEKVYWEDFPIDKPVHAAVSMTANYTMRFIKEVEVFVEKPAPMVRGNLQQLTQVFVNLVQNAVESITGQDGTVRIEASGDKENDRVLISVSDNGKGIKKENLKSVFDPFFSTKQMSGGTGLGLSITRSIVNDHGGTIQIQSEPDKGTTVAICLPVPEKKTALN